MSLIEKAAERLEELRRAGIDTPGSEGEDMGVSHAIDQQEAGLPKAVSAASMASEARTDSIASSSATSAVATQSRQVELDLAKLALAGFVTPNAPRSQTAEEFRVIKRPLIANASGGRATPITNGNLIMVTSSLPGEGKTFTAINLAMSIATELDRSVLLVDADVARPSVPRILGLPTTRGLLDVLQNGTKDLGDALLRTNIEKFSVLTSGLSHERSTELLASEQMARVLQEMAHRYSDRIIVFDSPPLLITTEARVLASHMGQIVFVVRAETTLQSEVMQALTTIEACPVKLIVFNQAMTSGAGAAGTYGYRYGYRYAS